MRHSTVQRQQESSKLQAKLSSFNPPLSSQIPWPVLRFFNLNKKICKNFIVKKWPSNSSFSGWDYDQLAERLTLCMQASWDKGLQQGVLRYHDPRLFAAVVDALDEQRQQLLLEPASKWHWLDRDGHARMLDTAALQQLPPLQWRHDSLTLEQEHIDTLSSWHLAETWRQNHLLVPESYGLDSEEEMIRRLALAHQAADKAKLWSEDERMPLVERYLGQGPA
ncbi:DUF4123 domain-containing protein [Chromobacterium amazonense]|uniref:DUF4123 domain-containing protein n=1 Tax=Chromobacterium amazonense TaxID=1382803 RepID=UPI0031F66D74